MFSFRRASGCNCSATPTFMRAQFSPESYRLCITVRVSNYQQISKGFSGNSPDYLRHEHHTCRNQEKVFCFFSPYVNVWSFLLPINGLVSIQLKEVLKISHCCLCSTKVVWIDRFLFCLCSCETGFFKIVNNVPFFQKWFLMWFWG